MLLKNEKWEILAQKRFFIFLSKIAILEKVNVARKWRGAKECRILF
jgi:hypothetical protein